ncbi:GNAT family N-acetyltransferase [Butyrivibrio sp. INlla16]|uniref:GNAT family N-acetyltransferase n=1 Tax=Butyrivibrio sp. INlla16 TaxID=1520807 RepID=UPI00088CA59F|nr:GNAT family N-acetyltransferase [Butyrivibrio sp. INlla16]SDB27313.1 L-amino acid N-acyltransferase YncA [Butyrivibrio sp. INlla16]
MRVEERRVSTKRGMELKLRTPTAEDAEKVLAFRRDVAGETVYLTRYPYEIENSVEKEREIIGNYLRAEHLGMIAIFDEDLIVGVTSVSPVGLNFKTRHRASAELVVRKQYWNLGLGSHLLDQAIELAENCGYERLELSVFADNARALRLYKKKGFLDCGQIPQAFKMMDGTYHDEILMSKNLWRH